MPEWKQPVRDRLRGLKLDGAREAEIVDELSQHLEDRYDALRSAGLPEAEAHRQALDELKDSRLLTEELGKIRRLPPIEAMGLPKHKGGYMSSFTSDLRVAFRNLRTKPAFSLMVVGMLALGIAGNAAIFSIFNGLFLRPLPFPEAQQLIDLDETAPKWNLHYVGVSNPDFYLWRSNNSTFDGMAFFTQSSFNLSDRGNAQRLIGANVTYDLLNVLRLKPALGRNFLPEEDRPGGAKVTMLGYDLWQRMFQGDRNVLGRVLQLDNESFTVVGVLPREAVLPDKCELWTPLAADPDPKKGTGWYLSGVGRMKQGVSPEQAQADLLRVHKSVIAEQDVNKITAPILTPLRDRILGDFRTVSRILLGAVAVVLLIACVNIAALMMVRGSTRAREIAIRTAMGASCARIVRQLLTENLVLAAVGGVLGVALGDLFLHAMISLIPVDNLPRWVNFTMDGRFAAFCAAITGVSALLFGLAPIIQASKVDTRGSLMDAGIRSSLSRGRRTTLGALVVCEIGLALMLSIGAALLVQAFHKVLNVDPGFRPENVISYRINLPDAKYPKPEQQIAFFENLVDRMRTLPGVKAVGATSAPPLGGHWGNFWEAEGNPPLGPNDKNPVVLQVVASPGYFDAIGMTFLDGHPFQDQEADFKHIREAVVNETFAKHFWGTAKPIGKRIRTNGSKAEWIEVVGLTRDEKHYGLDQEMKPSVFLPLHGVARNSMAIILRTSIEPQMLAAPAREVLRQLDPELPMYDVRTMTERLQQSIWARRAYSWLFGAFAIIAVVLAAAGVYGVVSYAVGQRTQEIGIRMALGAQPSQVMREILRGGMLMVAIGMALGVAGSLAAVRLLQTLLFGVSARDPWVYGAVLLGVAVVGLLANMVPAKRAASVDPMRALHFE
jgi:predicted permease